ncbi:MAG TPA: 2-phospho-L-lactate transferase [Anaerolineales bacterium]|nr:2-phospho-L-lactate transferase [Anaerolineales bacterium]
MNVVALAGGVGGAKLADGLAQVLPHPDLTIIVNTGDDFVHLGLKICPDLDTVCYTLAGLANPATGWGRAGETWQALETLGELGGPTWFRLGDRDLGLHLERTRRLNEGASLSEITRLICRAWGIGPQVLPMSDEPAPTWVDTDEGTLAFQEYFVHRQCRPHVTGFRLTEAGDAAPAPGVLDALLRADLVVFCPSNPWVSLDPILAVAGVRSALAGLPVVAVSPIIGGQTVKGPAAKMYQEMGIEPSPLAVGRHYQDLLSGLVIDNIDRDFSPALNTLGIQTLTTQTIMHTPDDRRHLAAQVLDFGSKFKM